MSASSKKKIRKEQNAAALTEKQLKEKSEAKKLRVSSVVFAILMVAILITGLTVMVIRGVQGSGIIEKNTIAFTVGDHKINSVVMNYYYTDTVSSAYDEWYSMYGDAAASYLSMLQLDLTIPLDEQPYYAGEGTWADYFMTLALDRAKADYVVYDIATAEGYTLSAEDQLNLDSKVNYKDLYAMYGGYSDVEDYMVAIYGPGASHDSYYDYCEVSAIASAYYNDYNDSLTYTDADIRAYEAGREKEYNTYTYASYYLGYSKFLDEGVTDPSDEQIAAAAALAKAEATKLIDATSVEELDAAIAALPINAESANPASTKNEHYLYSSVNSVVRDWVTSSTRKENDIAMIPNNVSHTEDDGTEVTTLNGYYVVMFQSSDVNTDLMDNVRHLLIKFEGGTKDESGSTVYSDEEKAAAKTEAVEHWNTWKNGDATEESFIDLATKYSQDSSAQNGGLIDHLYPGASYVANFLNWAVDPSRVVGDTDVIETEYGYHVMYYSGNDALSYRDYLITEELREADLNAWYTAVVDAVATVDGDLSKVKTDLVLAN